MVQYAIDMDIDVQSGDVDRMLAAVNTVLSPLALMGFLTTTVAPHVRRRAKDRFTTEGDEVSGPWAPLLQTTVEIRENSNLPIAGAHPINRRTGDLYEYITNSPDEVFPLGASGAQLTYPKAPASNVWTNEKVKTAQGGKRFPRTVPRPVLGLGIADLTFVVGALGIGIKKAGSFS